MTSISGRTAVVAVVGHPVGHSLSPVIHNAAFAASGLDWAMVPLEVLPDDGPRIVESLMALGLRGAAVTTPHKQAVARSVSEVAPAARLLDSVNTVVVREGRSEGHSTDGDGFVASLRAAGFEPEHRRIVVLGAGAAARSVIDALGRARAQTVSVVNRTEETGRRAADLSAVGVWTAPHELSERVSDADLLVNATSIGMGSDESPLDPDLLTPRHTVVDLVYHPRRTRLLADAERAGAATIDGLGMLVHQAALQQQLWTGYEPDVAAMWAAAESALAARG